jgi:hypothetical protein
MTVTVTVPASMSSDGIEHIYTDDSSPTTGLDGGGHVERLLPLILDNVSVANYVVTQATNSNSSATTASQWASLTTGLVLSTDYSSKAWAIGGVGVDTIGGSAKDWATKITTTVGNTTEYSAKEYAVGNVAQSAKLWASKLSTTVDGTSYSAKQYALNAQASADAAAQQSNTLTSTSTTNTTISTGSKTFTTQSGEQFIAGQFVTVASSANPANYMYGQVTSYSATTLIVNVTAIGGTGTFADWLISLSGLQGVQGNTGATGSVNTGNPTNINGLAKGNGSVLGTVVSGTDVKTINNTSILGAGNIQIDKTIASQLFTTSGTWTKPANVTKVKITLRGGGGSGGCGNYHATNLLTGGSGGGSGYITEGVFTVTGNITVTIGAGGTANGGAGQDGNPGGTTSVSGGVTASANGGSAGIGASGATNNVCVLRGGAGYEYGRNGFHLSGNATWVGGDGGGDSAAGGTRFNTINTNATSPIANSGHGGAGGYSSNTTIYSAGTAGAAGYCLIEWVE